MATSKTPPGLKAAGRRLWRSITEDFELAEHEMALLLQACRCVDRLDDLAKGMKDEPLTVTNARGDEVAHPILVESRQQAITLSRLLASLRIPDADDVRPPAARRCARLLRHQGRGLDAPPPTRLRRTTQPADQ